MRSSGQCTTKSVMNYLALQDEMAELRFEMASGETEQSSERKAHAATPAVSADPDSSSSGAKGVSKKEAQFAEGYGHAVSMRRKCRQ